MTRHFWRSVMAGFLALSAVAACEQVMPVVPPETPVAATPPVVEPPPELPRPIPSAESELLRVYYARLQRDLLSQGLLRGDVAPVDAPFTDSMLARNFVRVALYDEYVDDGSALRPEARISRLRRWEGPIRMQVQAGATVAPAQAARDRASVAAYAARLSRITALPIRQVTENANFTVLFLTEDDRRASGPLLRALIPGISDTTVRTIENLPRSTLCLVVGFSDGGGSAYSRAVAVIRAEHPDAMRLACIHEEIAQGLGLVNDSPEARPTIFNDNEEFGLLTRHDEFLLKILYDRRLRPGMTAAEAAPIARAIAAELVGGGS